MLAVLDRNVHWLVALTLQLKMLRCERPVSSKQMIAARGELFRIHVSRFSQIELAPTVRNRNELSARGQGTGEVAVAGARS